MTIRKQNHLKRTVFPELELLLNVGALKKIICRFNPGKTVHQYKANP